MADPKMHPDEIDTDAALVGRLLAEQFPQWADLTIRRVRSTGTDNAMFRIGTELCVRLPRIDGAVDSLLREQRWLPLLAPHLPLAVPVAVAVGTPTEEYPYPWSVLPWMDGDAATRDLLTDPVTAAEDLAGFLKALQAVDTAGAPAPKAKGRGGPIGIEDEAVRTHVAELGSALDAKAVLALWDRVLEVPAWSGASVWFHGDLQGGNLITRDGRLSAVIDFGPQIGDPACELMPAWNLFDGEARGAFRSALGVDDAMWERGRGWALAIALAALPYYGRLGTNPRIVADSWHVIGELLKEA
jgi:aminoglycoside phosphotransferase (APT) family kinase protein